MRGAGEWKARGSRHSIVAWIPEAKGNMEEKGGITRGVKKMEKYGGGGEYGKGYGKIKGIWRTLRKKKGDERRKGRGTP